MASTRLLRIALATTTLLVVAVFGAAWYFSSQVLYPNFRCDPDHHVFCGTPDAQNLSFETVTLETDDGVELDSWYMPAEGSNKAIVFVHGHGGTIHEGMRYAPALHEAGFNLLAFSLRGNMGKGSQNFYSMGYHERKDVKAAIDFIASNKAIETIGVFGFSLGAATAISAMAEDERITAGVFNSPYANVADQLADVAREQYGIPRYPLIPLVVWLAEMRGDANFSSVRAQDRIAEIAPRPVFVIHSKGDDQISVQHGQKVFDNAKAPKQEWFPAFDKHVHEWNWDKDKSEKLVTEFFASNLN